MTTIETLHNHLKALEDSDFISPAMIEQYRKAVEQVQAMQLPVQRIEDVEPIDICDLHKTYTIRTVGDIWLHDQVYLKDNGAFYDNADDAFQDMMPTAIGIVDYIMETSGVDGALNAATEEVTQ